MRFGSGDRSGLRVAVAYAFAPQFGLDWIWWAIPAGWFAADAAGLWRYFALKKS